MAAEKKDASTDNRLEKLDEDLRQAGLALQKVEHELEQALHQIWNLVTGVRKLEESAGDTGGVVAAIPGIQRDIRELRNQADRLQDQQNALAGLSENLGHQSQSNLEREREERASILKQAEAAARFVGQSESRLQLLEESVRRAEDAVSEAHLSQQTLGRDMEELSNRSARNLETSIRLEHDMSSHATNIEALQKRDGELEEKMNLREEKHNQQKERLDKFESHISLPLEIKEELDRARFERQQISERLSKLEAVTNGLSEKTADFVQGVARLDQRTQGHGARLLEMAEELRTQRETLFEQLKRMIQTTERQRRRQAETLAQEIRELSRSEFNPQE
jgi:chromosome segregation ATPase